MKYRYIVKRTVALLLSVLMLTACFSVSASAAGEFTSRKDFSWGINGHNYYYKSYPIRSVEEQIDLAAELGVDIYRFNLNPKSPSDYDYLDIVVDLVERYGMKLLLVMDDNVSSPEVLRLRYETVAKRYNGKNGHGTIPYIQVFNEVDVWCMHAKDFPDKPIVEGDGTLPSHYSKKALEFMLPRFKAAMAGVKAGNPQCKTVINISYMHTFLFDYLKDNGVKWDITGLDWYANMGSYDKILRRVQDRYPQDIFICETNIWPFNPGMESDYENDTTFLPNAMRHVYHNYPHVKAMIFYELLDEPDFEIHKGQYEGESHFGFVKVNKNDFSIGTKKPIYYQVQKMLGGGPKEPAPEKPDPTTPVKPTQPIKPTANKPVPPAEGNATQQTTTTSAATTQTTGDDSTTATNPVTTPSDGISSSTSPADKPVDNAPAKMPVWAICVICAAAVLAAAGVTAFIIVRKKKAGGTDNPKNTE